MALEVDGKIRPLISFFVDYKLKALLENPGDFAAIAASLENLIIDAALDERADFYNGLTEGEPLPRDDLSLYQHPQD